MAGTKVWLGRLVACWMVAALVSGCLVEPADHKIWNRSSGSIEVVRVRTGGEYVVVTVLEPGQFYPLNYGDTCPDVLLVARTTAGVEIARRSGPFCRDDEWLIGGPAQSTGPTDVPEVTPTPVPT